MPPRRNGWHEVDRNFRCPCCGQDHWCGYNERGVVCMRTENGKPTSNGGWFMSWASLQVAPPVPTAPADSETFPQAVGLARPERLNRVYSAWLKLLPWKHQEHMLGRGMGREEQDRRGYRSYSLDPLGACDLARELVARVGEPEGVPGFYPTKRGWSFYAPRGILIPVKDREGRIVALKVRRDDPDARRRYQLVSSVRRRGGASPGLPAHWAFPKTLKRPDILGVTEGEIKADIAADRLGIVFVSAPGVSNWRAILPVPTAKVAIFYDQDEKAGVRRIVERHKKMLADNLKKSGVKVCLAEWNPVYKGIDDALVAGEKIRLEPA